MRAIVTATGEDGSPRAMRGRQKFLWKPKTVPDLPYLALEHLVDAVHVQGDERPSRLSPSNRVVSK